MLFLGAAMGSLRPGTEGVGTHEWTWQVGTAEAEQAACGTFPTLSFPGLDLAEKPVFVSKHSCP